MSGLMLEPQGRGPWPPALYGPARAPSGPPMIPTAPLALFGQGAFGHRMAEAFGLAAAPTLTTTALKRAQLAATRLTSASAAPGAGLTSPIAPEKAYLVTLQLRDLAAGILWIGGQSVQTGPLGEGSISIVHLEDEPVFHFAPPFDCLQFYIPEILFEELSAGHGAPAISGLTFQAHVVDRVIQQLGAALLPSLAAPGPAGRQFFDHIALAIYSHLAGAYGQPGEPKAAPAGRLTLSQERQAKALLAADLTQEPSIARVSVACGLPVGRFVRAFRQTTGMPPHRWLRQFRVERAQALLFGSRLSLAQIAYDCGFSDQSHFTRVFTAAIGITPGLWRRQRRA
jgi:AraC family transcriptional regulator